MKTTNKPICIIALAALIGLLSAGCASQLEAEPDGITLDQAIADAALRIDERIAAGSKIALLNFSSPSDRFSLYVLDELSANLLDSGRLTVVDRREVDLIRGEFDFQFSGEVGDESMQSMGQMLGAQSIVSGSLTEIGGDYRIAIRVLNVQSAAIEVHFRSDIANDRRVQALLEGGRTGAGSVPQWLAAAQAPAAQTVRAAAQTVQPPVAQAPVQAQPVAPPAPVIVQAQEQRLESGRRTFHPRPQAYQGARAVTAFVYYIVVRNEYMTIQIRAVPAGGIAVLHGFQDWSRALLQDLDRPDRQFTPVQGGAAFYHAWLTFRNVNATRLSLVCTVNTPRIVFDEIRIGDPD
ncbi:MAG: hypothetical protein FWB79_00935 [Treponema sp.]|nr:hypothetical protein [Treponema sp.]